MKTHWTLAEITGRKSSKPDEMVGIFGYGSLVAKHEMEMRRRPDRPEPRYAILDGYQRNWEACAWPLMGLSQCFLGIAPKAGASTYGVVFWVDEFDLNGLDMREGIYDRVLVSGKVYPYETKGLLSGKIYTYVPDKDARKRYSKAISKERAFFDLGYFNLCKRAFEGQGHARFAWNFLQQTELDERMKAIDLYNL